MLGLLRRKAQSPYIQGTILVIILVFVFWGIKTGRQGGRNVMAMVNDEPISLQDYQKALDRAVDQYRERFGGNLPENFLKTMGIKRQVLDQIIRNTLIRQGAREMGLAVSKDEIREGINSIQAFKNEGGIFDQYRYKQILSRSRLTPAMFEAGMSSDLLAQKVMDHISRFAGISPAELKDRFNAENMEIKLEYAAFHADDFKDKVTVTNDSLAAFFAEHQDEFKTPPQIKLKYLQFLYREDQDQLHLTDEVVENYYQEHIQDYNIPEKRQARHILIKTSKNDTEDQLVTKKKLAEEILALARSGKDFAGLAKQYSEDTSAADGGDLGLFARGQMVKPFEDKVFSMQEGEISDVVETRFGLHIIKLEKIEPAHQKTIDEVRSDIETTLKKEQGNSLTFARANDAYEKIILSGSLEKYAADSSAEIKESEFFTKQAPPEGILSDQAVTNAAFALNKGELSSLIEGRDGYAIIVVEDLKDPEVPPLADIRERVETEFIAGRARVLAQEKADAMLAELKTGTDFQKAAEKFSVLAGESVFFTIRKVTTRNLPNEVIKNAFNLSAERPYPEKPAAKGDTFYVYAFKELRAPAADLFDKQRDKFKERLLRENNAGLFNAWLANLQSKAKITIKEEFLD